MPRVSDHFKLNRTQPSLDFVDVDVYCDLRLFVDPRALRLLPSQWGDECVSLIQDFFSTVMEAIRHSDTDTSKRLLMALREPNETHLGLSRGPRSRGRALGRESVGDVWEALSSSEAAKSGLLEDLEDTILLVDGISSDIISDITTNIIRQPLVHYTQTACDWYGIPLQAEVDSGPMWDPQLSDWVTDFVQMPVTDSGKLLLVPKAIVRKRLEYDADEYYRGYILEHLREVELSANSELVRTLKNGRRRVTKKSLSEKYGSGKGTSLRETQKDPSLLTRYRNSKRDFVLPPLDHQLLAEEESTPPPDWKELLLAVTRIHVGRESATEYERAIESLLSALLYPSLCNPQLQKKIHDGRKRIDITYTNMAQSGFFWWLSHNFSAAHVFVECKNYSEDPSNPELDQLGGRFSPSRGQFGLLICRSISDKQLFAARCRDTADDQRGFIICLDDDDLKKLIDERMASIEPPEFSLLRERFDKLVM